MEWDELRILAMQKRREALAASRSERATRDLLERSWAHWRSWLATAWWRTFSKTPSADRSSSRSHEAHRRARDGH